MAGQDSREKTSRKTPPVPGFELKFELQAERSRLHEAIESFLQLPTQSQRH